MLQITTDLLAVGLAAAIWAGIWLAVTAVRGRAADPARPARPAPAARYREPESPRAKDTGRAHSP